MDNIQQHYAEDISLLTLGEQLHVNPNYLGRLFKKETGMNFTDYLVSIRMDHAKRLLKQTTLKVYEITHEIGYEDNAYFSRLFKALHEMTPNEYRNLDKSYVAPLLNLIRSHLRTRRRKSIHCK